MKERQIDAEIKKNIDARTKEFKEKLSKLAYERIKQKLAPATEPLKGYPYNESVEEASSTSPNMAKAVQGLNDLGYKLKGRDSKDVQRVEKLFRSGNKKVLQGAMRALDTDIRDQIMDILEPLGFVKDGVVEAMYEENVKKGDSVKIINAKKYDALSKPEVSGIVIGMLGSKVMVKVGSGQMNVDPKDLVKESVELDESVSKIAQAHGFKKGTGFSKGSYIHPKTGHSITPLRGNTFGHSDASGGTVVSFQHKDSLEKHLAKHGYKKEEAELDEAFKKGDSVTVKNASKYDSLSKPEVSGTVIGMIGSKVMVKVGSGQMNVDAKDLVKESVELDEMKLEFHVRLDRLDKDKRLLDKVKDLLKKHERAGHISFEYETDKGVVFTAKSKSYIDAVRKDVETKPYYALVDFSESVELDERIQLKVSDMTEKAMTLKQLAVKYKGDIAKAQQSGNTDSLKKAEKELIAWAMDNNEINNAKEAGVWLDNVVADKDQFDALLKFSKN